MGMLNLSKMGLMVFAVCIAAEIAAPAQSFTTLLSFDGSNGAYSEYGYPIQGSDMNIYGTTSAGGTYDQGTIFKLTPGGTLTTLYNFCSKTNCTDGAQPFGGLLQFSDGNFYGTTYTGGTHGWGTVFKITPAGVLTTLHSFAGGPNDGGYPYAGLIAVGGNFYGTTWYGGANSAGAAVAGTVFEVTPAGKLTILYSFCSQSNCADGAGPYAALVETGGNLYGTTSAGGTNSQGTVFEITQTGTLTTLHDFCSQGTDGSCTDGGSPYAGLVFANGNLYGTTTWGGGASYVGNVYQITLAGQLTSLYSFCSKTNCTDGDLPYGGLAQASDGNLYGTTEYGGTKNQGTLFKVTTAGKLTTLHSFSLANGIYPYGGLVEGNGVLYGATSSGGSRYDGTIFSLSLGKK